MDLQCAHVFLRRSFKKSHLDASSNSVLTFGCKAYDRHVEALSLLCAVEAAGRPMCSGTLCAIR